MSKYCICKVHSLCNIENEKFLNLNINDLTRINLLFYKNLSIGVLSLIGIIKLSKIIIIYLLLFNKN